MAFQIYEDRLIYNALSYYNNHRERIFFYCVTAAILRSPNTLPVFSS